jgi:hypothetical protein
MRAQGMRSSRVPVLFYVCLLYVCMFLGDEGSGSLQLVSGAVGIVGIC